MKQLFRYRTASLFLFLILLAQHAQAQGTEGVFEALWSLILPPLALAGLACLFLFIFIVKRTKAMAAISGIFGLILLLYGLWLVFILDSNNNLYLASAGSMLQMCGMLNLLLIFIFTVVFPKKQALDSVQETVSEAHVLPDGKAGSTLKWTIALFSFWCFYSLLGAVQFLSHVLILNTYRIRTPDIYMIVERFLMVLVLLAGIILFIQKTRAGWNLLLFSSIYSMMGILVFTVRNALFQHNGQLRLPASFFVWQGIIFLFVALCAWLLTRSAVLNIFGTSKKSRNLAFISSIAIVVIWAFLTQQIVFFLS